MNICSLHEVFHLCHVFIGELIRWNCLFGLYKINLSYLEKARWLGAFHRLAFPQHSIYVCLHSTVSRKNCKSNQWHCRIYKQRSPLYLSQAKVFPHKMVICLICVCGTKQLNGIIKILIYFNEDLTRELLIFFYSEMYFVLYLELNTYAHQIYVLTKCHEAETLFFSLPKIELILSSL